MIENNINVWTIHQESSREFSKITVSEEEYAGIWKHVVNDDIKYGIVTNFSQILDDKIVFKKIIHVNINNVIGIIEVPQECKTGEIVLYSFGTKTDHLTKYFENDGLIFNIAKNDDEITRNQMEFTNNIMALKNGIPGIELNFEQEDEVDEGDYDDEDDYGGELI